MIKKDDVVIMVDFSLEHEDMKRLNNMCNFIWLDHHISAINDNKHLHITGIQNIEAAGCYHTWKWFNPNIPVPKFVQYISDFDTWNLRDNKCLYFKYFLDFVF